MYAILPSLMAASRSHLVSLTGATVSSDLSVELEEMVLELALEAIDTAST